MWCCNFLRFQISGKNARICGFHWTFKSKKCFSFRGQAPWPSDQGLWPWTPLGAPPQTPVIGSRSARSPCPLFQILNTPLVTNGVELTIEKFKVLDYDVREFAECGHVSKMAEPAPKRDPFTGCRRFVLDNWKDSCRNGASNVALNYLVSMSVFAML